MQSIRAASSFCQNEIFSYLCQSIGKPKITNYTMMKEMTEMVTRTYEPPMCEIVDVHAEGVLCASMEQLKDYENDYEW